MIAAGETTFPEERREPGRRSGHAPVWRYGARLALRRAQPLAVRRRAPERRLSRAPCGTAASGAGAGPRRPARARPGRRPLPTRAGWRPRPLCPRPAACSPAAGSASLRVIRPVTKPGRTTVTVTPLPAAPPTGLRRRRPAPPCWPRRRSWRAARAGRRPRRRQRRGRAPGRAAPTPAGSRTATRPTRLVCSTSTATVASFSACSWSPRIPAAARTRSRSRPSATICVDQGSAGAGVARVPPLGRHRDAGQLGRRSGAGLGVAAGQHDPGPGAQVEFAQGRQGQLTGAAQDQHVLEAAEGVLHVRPRPCPGQHPAGGTDRCASSPPGRACRESRAIRPAAGTSRAAGRGAAVSPSPGRPARPRRPPVRRGRRAPGPARGRRRGCRARGSSPPAGTPAARPAARTVLNTAR